MPTREEMRSLAEEIVRSYEDRIVGIAQIKQAESERKQTEAREIAQRKSDVGTMLKGFGEEQAAMSKELKADLAKVAPALRQTEAERKQTEAREIAQRKSDVSTMLKEFDDSHATMSKELKADLSKVAPALREAESERKRTSTQEISERKSDVSTMLRSFSAELKDIRSELAGGRDEWQILSTIMQEKRGGTMLKVKPPVEEIAEEAAEITPETATLRNQVFEYLANHPDGSKMTELEKEFGMARIQMAKLLKALMNENKVKKQGLLYLAI